MEDIIDIIVTETTNLIEITSQPTDEVIDVNIIDNREDITLNVTPSVVEININQLTGNFGILWGEIEGTLSNQTDLQNALNLKADLVDGKVPSSQLPSYVDDVVEVANYAALPATGEVGKIYITLDTNFIYRWTGSTYVEIKDSSAVWGAITGTLSNQTDLQNALNAKDAVLTFSSPLSRSTNTVSIPAATSSANGYLTSTDWSTFNGKQAALSGTGFVKISGTTISYDNSTYLTTSAAASTYLALTGGTLTGTLIGTRAEFTTSTLVDGVLVNNGSGRGIRIVNAGAGYGLIINNETASSAIPFVIQKSGLDKVYFTDSGAGNFASSLTASSFVKNGGTSAQFLKADGSVDSSTYLTTGTAASTYLPLAGGTLTGTLSGTSVSLSSSVTASALYVTGMTAGNGAIYHTASRLTFANYNASGTLHFEVNGGVGALTINSDKSATFEAGASFASGISGTSSIFSNNVKAGSSGGGVAGGFWINYSADTASRSWKLVNDQYLYGDFDIQQSTTQTGTSYTSRLYINPSGNVGIGTNSPIDFIDATSGLAVMSTSGRAGITIGSTTTTANEVLGRLSFTNTNSTNAGSKRLAAISGLRGTTNNSAYLEFVVANDALGAQVMTLNQSGYLTVGGLRLKGSDTANTIYNANSNMAITAESGYNISIGRSSDITKALNVNTTNGYVGIGTSSQKESLEIAGLNGNIRIYGRGGVTQNGISSNIYYNGSAWVRDNGSTGAGAIRFDADNNSIVFNTDTTTSGFPAERMRITNGGFLKATTTGSYISSTGSYHELTSNQNNPTLYLLNHDGAGEGLLVNLNTNGTTYNFFRGYSNSAGANRIIIYSNGNVVNANNSYGAISDIKLKENISDSTPKLADLLKVKVKNFNFIGSDDKQLGVIAQELEEVFPSMIDISPDRDVDGNDLGTVTKSVKYSVFVPMLIKAVQELSDKIKTLENK